jgi:NAD(P)-dependent dehydrogenase (short-subunit alcohol dehydrogenase family)
LRCATRGKCRAALERRRIVTGAARGIWTEIARGFAREGAKVCIADRILEAAQAAAAKIENEGGVATALAVDVTDESKLKLE